MAVESPSLSIVQKELVQFFFLDDITRSSSRAAFNHCNGRDLSMTEIRQELYTALGLLRRWFRSHGVEDFRDLM
jgi:hypothetical protein